MKHNITMFDLLLSCPGDAYKECYPAVRKAIEIINADPQINNSISVSLKHWSTSSYPQSGGQAQKLLNSQIVKPADIAIAIFWTRFGTPTDDYNSGTEEEIDLLIKNKRQVFLYFLDKPIPPSITDSPEYTENRKKITLFQKMKIENSPSKWYRSDTGKEVLPTELLKYGNMTAQIDGTVARVEVCKPDGKTIYTEIDTKNNSASHIVAEGFPQEYVIDIPQNIIINKEECTTIIQGITYRVEIYLLKFNGYVQAIYDINDNKLQDINIQAPAGMTAFVDTTNNKIRIINKDDIKGTIEI